MRPARSLILAVLLAAAAVCSLAGHGQLQAGPAPAKAAPSGGGDLEDTLGSEDTPVQARVELNSERLCLPDRWIVVFKPAASDLDISAHIDAIKRIVSRPVLTKGSASYADSVPPEILFRFTRGFASRLGPIAVLALQRSSLVSWIECDQPASVYEVAQPIGNETANVTAFLQSVPAVIYRSNWGLDRIDQLFPPLDQQYVYNATGCGVNAYVIDTGVAVDHGDFQGRAFRAYDNQGGSGFAYAYDCHGHGTHVAGILGSTTYGVAKRVTLWSVRAVGCGGTTSVAALIDGISWVARNGRRPAVINISVVSGYSAALNEYTAWAVASGIAVVVGAGNSNKDACSRSPASAAAAITVGGTDRPDPWDGKALYSNYGPCVDVFAPGTDILSLAPGPARTEVAYKSGTSMATPHVAGAVATYLELYPAASPAEVARAVVAASAVNVILGLPAGTPNRLLSTRGIVNYNLPSALPAATGACAYECPENCSSTPSVQQGVCAFGKCVCSTGWTGAACGTLAFCGVEAAQLDVCEAAGVRGSTAGGEATFYFRVRSTGNVRLSLCSRATDHDASLRVFRNCPAPPPRNKALAYSAAGEGPMCGAGRSPSSPPELNLYLAPGWYFAVVAGLRGARGSFGLSLQSPASCGPSGVLELQYSQLCANVPAISACSASVNGSTAGVPPMVGTNPSGGLVYRLDVAVPGLHAFDLCSPATTFDTNLALFASCPMGLADPLASLLAANDDGPPCRVHGAPPASQPSALSAVLQPGVYYLLVEGYGAASGSFGLNVRGPAGCVP
eukprot:tig00000655_g2867.t1